MPVTPAPDRDWLTVPEAAARLGLNASTVYQLLGSGALGSRRVGPARGRYQVTLRHIEAYLAACETRPARRGGAPAPAGKGKPKPAGRGDVMSDGEPFKYSW